MGNPLAKGYSNQITLFPGLMPTVTLKFLSLLCKRGRGANLGHVKFSLLNII